LQPRGYDDIEPRRRREYDARRRVADPHRRQVRIFDGKPGTLDADASAFNRSERMNSGDAGGHLWAGQALGSRLSAFGSRLSVFGLSTLAARCETVSARTVREPDAESPETALRIVQLSVPVQVIAPALRRVSQAHGNADGRGRLGTFWHPQQVHAGFSRRPPTFLAVARDTTGDDVLPVFPAALGDRQHVVERQLAGRKRVAAILTGMIVAGVNICPRKRHVVESPPDLDVAQQANDRGKAETDFNRADLPVVFRD